MKQDNSTPFSVYKMALLAVAIVGSFAIAPAASAADLVDGLWCNNYYSLLTDIPAGYGAAYNLFSVGKEPLVDVDCEVTPAILTAGSGAQNQYIYENGWAYARDYNDEIRWVPFALSGTKWAGTGFSWFVGTAQGELPYTSTELNNWNYAVVYVCQWINNAWKCGCSDAPCTQGKWQLQAFILEH